MSHRRNAYVRYLLGSGALSLAMLGASVAAAQASASAAAPASQPASNGAASTAAAAEAAPGDIVVTAQVRSERVQDVPVSIQVLSNKMLVQQNLQSLGDVSDYAPSVHVNSGIATNDLYIRGIGSGNNPAFDQGVGTFIDDIYHGRSRSSSADFFDLDRIEILKGPQSTFFGNNAIAGAFNLATKAPGDTFGGFARLLYGSFNDRAAEVGVDVPIAPGLSARAAVHYDGTDGWLKNVTTGGHDPKNNNFAGRFTLRYHPDDDLDIKLKVQKSVNDSSGGTLQTNNCPAPAPLPNGAFCSLYLSEGFGGLVGLDKDKVAHNSEAVHLNTSEYVLSTSYKKWGHTFSLVAGYLDYNFKQDIDADATPQNLLDLSTPENYRQYSGEFRVTSPSDQPIEYLFGVYGQDDRLNSTRVQALAFLTPALAGGPLGALVANGALAQKLSFRQTEQSYAAFGSATWHITPRLSVTGGLRYTKVDKHLTSIDQFGNQAQPFGPITLLPGTLSALPTPATGLQALPGLLGLGKAGTIDSKAGDHAFLPSAKLQYKLNPDVMFYASYARGFLAGGFNGQDISGNPANVPYDPEHVNAYEVGVKSELFDRKLTLNVDVFRSDYSNLQVQQYEDGGGGSVISVVDNAASSRTQGVELEANWRVTHALTLGATVTYLHARYQNYKNVGLTSLQTFCHAAANHGNASCVADFGGNGDPGALQDLSGKPTSYAPTWSGNVNASYQIALGDFDLTPAVSALFNSKYFPGGPGTDDPELIQHGYVRLDARISLTKTNSGLAIDLIGKNLTNKNIITSITNWPNAAGSFLAAKEEPRNIAVQVRYNF